MSTNAKTIAALGETVAPERQIVIAGIGEAWASDQGDDGPVAHALAARELPSGVSVHELGTGALDIAYDVMRGYDALVLIDVGRHGGEAAVTEADEASVDATIEDGQEVNHLGLDAATVLHFVKHVGGWPGKVMIVPCEAGGGDAGAVAAVDRALETVAEMQNA